MAIKDEIFGFSQEKVLQYEKGASKDIAPLDVDDLLILRLIADLWYEGECESEEKEGKKYFILCFNDLLERLPILRMSKQDLIKRTRKLGYFRFIEGYVYLNDKGEEDELAFRIGDLYEKILHDNTIDEEYLEKWGKERAYAFIRIFLKYREEYPDFVTYTQAFEDMQNNKYIDWQTIMKHIERMNYDDFLHSLYWMTISRIVKRRDGFKCALCGSNEKLEVHHKTYENHGDELHHLDDLICLCHECHAKFHDKK